MWYKATPSAAIFDFPPLLTSFSKDNGDRLFLRDRQLLVVLRVPMMPIRMLIMGCVRSLYYFHAGQL